MVHAAPFVQPHLAAPHAGIEGGDDHGVKVAFGGSEQRLLFGNAQHLPPGAPFATTLRGCHLRRRKN